MDSVYKISITKSRTLQVLDSVLSDILFLYLREKKIERTLAPTRGQASQVLDPELVRKDLSELKSGYQPGVKNSEVKI